MHHTRLAARRQTRASLQVAYHLPVHEKYLFSVGLSGGALFQQRTLQNVPVLDPGDHIFEEEMVAQRWPQAQVGFMLTGPQGWGGISIPVFHFGPFATEESERFPVAFVGVLGRRFSIKDKLAVQTVAQVHVDPTRPVRADLQAQLQLGHILGVGLALSGVESLDGQIEYTLMEGVRMGYSVGLVRFGSQGSLPEAYRNSHEITLSIRPISFSRDMDRDRVTDWEDACPRLKGERELQGCPSQ
ncbi:MAG TPA: hypothetical protein DCE41_21425 [Cytophagales bacterium]|nr:hypothetical protein [Cytophagales bacterium]